MVCAPLSPKKKRKRGSSACGLRRTGLVATTLTTAGAARRAASAKPLAGVAEALGAGTAAVSVGAGRSPAVPMLERGSHSGFNVSSTNNTARATVTACENRSQVLRHMVRAVSKGSESSERSEPPMARRDEVDACLRELLQPQAFKDYGPNGLQIEGGAEVRHIVSGVTASLAFIDAAIERGADTLLVHHGLFWRGQDGRLTGWLKARVARLMAHDINLFAFHLPLDAHAELGNNAQLGLRLGLRADARFGEQDLGFIGDAAAGPLGDLVRDTRAALGRELTVVPGDGRALRRVAWCTGGAQGYFEAAVAAGADVFLTGEISEPQAHLARETGVAFVACGHHATERYGAPAVAAQVAERFGLRHEFIEIPNPA